MFNFFCKILQYPKINPESTPVKLGDKEHNEKYFNYFQNFQGEIFLPICGKRGRLTKQNSRRNSFSYRQQK